MPKTVRFHQLGDADVLRIEDLPVQEPKAGEVRIKVAAIGLNRAEVMFRRGEYLEQPKLPARIGYEASGVIEAVGPGVTGFKVGDRVSTIPSFSMNDYGVYGENVVAPVHAAAHYPESLTPIEATSIWMQYLTAWGALIHYAKIKAGDYVLVTAGSSSVGLAALDIAKVERAKVIMTTRRSSKSKALLDAGADFVIATEEEDLPKRVAEITGGKGAQVIFDPIGGKFLEKLAEAASQGAQIIEYGALAEEPTPYPLFTALSKGLVIRAYTLFEINAAPGLREQGVKYVLQHLESGSLKPRIARTFTFDKIVDAHRYMESNQQTGKIVVTV